METFPLIMSFLVAVGLVLLLPMFTCTRHASVERELKPLWQEKCSGTLGSIGINLPAIRISLYEKFMVIGFVGPTVIPYKNIEKVTVKRSGSFLDASGVCLKLRSMRSGYLFNSRDPNALAKLIEARL